VGHEKIPVEISHMNIRLKRDVIRSKYLIFTGSYDRLYRGFLVVRK